jgi:predicted glycoside hydrolase/deacetylase ChbG (UPF0249 family)
MSPVLKVGAEVGILTADEFKTELKAQVDRIVAAFPGDPIFQNTHQVGSTKALLQTFTTDVTLNLGGPHTNRIWDVRRINVSGVSAEDTVTGAVRVYRETVDAAHYVDDTTTIPNVGTWNPHQCVILPGEHLIVRFTGLSSAGIVTVIASAAFVDEPWAEREVLTV